MVALLGSASFLLAGFLLGNHACWRLDVKLLDTFLQFQEANRESSS